MRVVRSEAELEHRHAGEAELPAQLDHGGVDVAEVLGQHGQLAEIRLSCVEESAARARLPATGHRGLGVGGDGPVRGKPAEVVEADVVEQLEGPAQSLYPPAESVGGHDVPAVERVAPELPGRGIGVRWDARHRIAAEEVRPCPDVGAVGRDIDRGRRP